MEITNKPIRKSNYFSQSINKDTILLHHTVSSNATSPYSWFNRENNKSRVGVAYIVGKDGKIYELFDPQFWAYHTGTGNRNEIDQRSVGIEIVNEGWLTKKGDDYFWLDGMYPYNGNIFESDNLWRGHRFYASYTQKQYEAVNFLIKRLFIRFPDIKKTFSNNLAFDKKYFYNDKGIISHVNIRKDKTDLSVAYDLSQVNNLVKGYRTDYEINVEAKPIEELR